MQEAVLADPAAPLDEFAVQDRDLPGGPAEADEAELQPEAEGFDARNADWGNVEVGVSGDGVESLWRASVERWAERVQAAVGAS